MEEDEHRRTDVSERVEIKLDVVRGSVPSVRASASDLEKPRPNALDVLNRLRRTATGNILFSLFSLIAAHPVAAFHAFAAVVVFTSQVLTFNPQGSSGPTFSQPFQPVH